MAKNPPAVPDLTGIAPEIQAYIDGINAQVTDLSTQVLNSVPLSDLSKKVEDELALQLKSGAYVAKADVEAIEKRAGDAEKTVASLQSDFNNVVSLIGDRAPDEPLVSAVERALSVAASAQDDAHFLDIVRELPLERVNDDLMRAEKIDSEGWLYIETINFRADSGYSINMADRAQGALKRAFYGLPSGDSVKPRSVFGSLDSRSQPTYDALPPFDAANRLFIMFGLLPESSTPVSGVE